MFEDFVAGRGQALQGFGYALTGDWALAEDLLQTALARAYPRWSRIQRDDPESYVRKIMVNTWSSWWRRKWRGELPAMRLPETAGPDAFAGADHRHALRAALAQLPPRQRAVVVLRYHQDMSEAQVADLLGISGRHREESGGEGAREPARAGGADSVPAVRTDQQADRRRVT